MKLYSHSAKQTVREMEDKLGAGDEVQESPTTC